MIYEKKDKKKGQKKRARFYLTLESWGVEDSNLWRREPRDLQSLAIAAMRTPHFKLLVGFGPTTPRLQITCSTS